ncbi:hypothetical protein PVBG_05939 [Plasmodium vivax Brazil I]|uniref:Variable surface protein n=1 Tax=Plasmodium vivax (strain Brazil I) TaxID=1033975 RepID=A0A0J9SN68_PLAV1|nr:hypothetical protein PVBG_05939 [Plasmodium vivax Brazil I]
MILYNLNRNNFILLLLSVCAINFHYYIIHYNHMKECSNIKNVYNGEILKLYDTLDKSVDENNVNPKIITYCDKNSSLQMDTTGKHIRICKKLLKNLLLLKGYYNSDFIKNCGNLYVWLYFEIKKSMISNDIIKEIFEFSTSIEDDEVKYNYCSYFLFNDNIPNPENLMKLRIFNDNADTFQNMLMDSINSKDCYLKKYVYECVDIYKKMNKNYSSSGDCSSSQHENACEIIKTFNTLYTSYILNKEEITHNFPKLSTDTPLNVIDSCQLEEGKSDTHSDATQQGICNLYKNIYISFTNCFLVYPFLEEIWDIYNSYIVNENKSEYDEILSYCDKSPLLRSDTTGKYIKFCKNLSRNVLLLADCDYTGEKFNKYCVILYMWMYFEINKNGIPNNITEKLFNASTQVVTTKRHKTPCHYFNFNEKYHEPTKLRKITYI